MPAHPPPMLPTVPAVHCNKTLPPLNVIIDLAVNGDDINSLNTTFGNEDTSSKAVPVAEEGTVVVTHKQSCIVNLTFKLSNTGAVPGVNSIQFGYPAPSLTQCMTFLAGNTFQVGQLPGTAASGRFNVTQCSATTLSVTYDRTNKVPYYDTYRLLLTVTDANNNPIEYLIDPAVKNTGGGNICGHHRCRVHPLHHHPRT